MTQKELEQEWAKYKYWVMGKSHQAYKAIRLMFKNNEIVDPQAFYKIIDDLKDQPLSVKNEINALEHVWGYFKKSASKSEKEHFFCELERFRQGLLSLSEVKAILYELAKQNQQDYLLSSYYFNDLKNKGDLDA